MKTKPFAIAALSLAILELCLLPASWMLSVVFPDSGLRSLLGSEGVRWLLGRYTDMIAGRPLACLLLLSVAWGCASSCGISRVFRRHALLQYRERIAFASVASLSVVYIAVLAWLTLMPHAVLLSVTGDLFPSPFSASLIPVLSFGVCLVSVVYGIVSGRFRTVTDVYRSLFCGISLAAPIFFLYILLIQLYYSFMFVIG